MSRFTKKKLNKYTFFGIVLLITGNLFCQDLKPLIEVSSSVDTSVITIGDRVRYSISIEHADTLKVAQPGEGVNLGQFEIKDYEIHEPVKREGRIFKKYDYVISVFDTGKFTIPPFPLAYFPTDSMSNYKIIEASAINIYVKSVVLDDKKELHDIKQPIYIPYNYFFLISMISIGLLVIVIGYLAYKFYKKRKEKGYLFKPPEPPRPAHEIALESLETLLSKNLIEQGKIKDFYIELSDIIRRYIEGRYYITALEETSAEILEEISEQSLSEDLSVSLKILLELSDFVKFAKYIPAEQENNSAIEYSRNFINETKLEFKNEDQELVSEETQGA